MESSRFDAFVRALDGALSRRGALAAMLLAALPAAPLSALETAGKGQRGRGRAKRGRGKAKRRGGNGQGGNEPRGNAGNCDAAACAAAGGCCAGNICVRGAGQWTPQVAFGRKGDGLGQFDRPAGVAVSGDEQTLWVADFDNHRISVWIRSGDGWLPQTTFGRKGDGADQFDNPRGVAVSADGQTVWVAESNNDRISVWTRSGSGWVNQTTFSRKGNGPSQLENPEAVAVSGDGHTVWVADTGNERISVWTRSGSTWVNLTTFGKKGDGLGEFDAPRAVAVSANGQTAWVADLGNNRVSVWARSPRIWSNQATFGRKGEGAGQFHDPVGVAVAADGQTVWVADEGNFRIARWVKSGDTWANETIIGSRGEDPDQFDGPRGVAVSADERTVWVADTQNHRIAVWIKSDSGNWIPQTTFGGFGGDPNELRFPTSVAIGADEQAVWVADTTNNRISVWALTCPPA